LHENSARFGILAIQELTAPDDHQRVHVDSVEEMPKLTRDIAAADNRDRLRHFVELEDFVAGPIWNIERSTLRAAAGGQDELVGGDGGIVDTESSVGSERGAVAIERDVLSERLFEDAVVFFREVKGVAQNRIGTGSSHSRLEAKPPRVAPILGRVGVTDEQFRRDASPMGTGAAQRSFFDQRDLQAFGAALLAPH